MINEETVVFYHLPKTAGTTLNRILKQNYQPQELVECTADTHAFIADFKTWPESRLRQIRLLQGHFPFGIHELLPNKTRCFTLVRDPVERVISYYYHAVRDGNHYLHQLIHDNQWSLPELLDSGLALMMNDAQVRLLSGVWGDAPFGAVDETMLARAIDCLHACAVVGVTEEFDATLLLLQHHFGWRHIRYTRANTGGNRVDTDRLPAETVATIRRYNQLDQRLYEAAVRLFQQQCHAAGPLFPWRVAAFRLNQRLYRSPATARLRRIRARLAAS